VTIAPIRGRVWKFGDDVDTDVMAPWNSIGLPWEERRSQVLHVRPEFAEQVRPGDVIVAGRNWGCGSSREQAPENLRELGIAAVVAESFGRIYFRNAVAMAFPHLVCPGILGFCDEGDEIEIDLAGAVIRHGQLEREIAARPWAPEMLQILERGGLMAMLEERVRGAAS